MACTALPTSALQALLAQAVAANQKGIDASNSERYRALVDGARYPMRINQGWGYFANASWEVITSLIGNYFISPIKADEEAINNLRLGAAELSDIATQINALRRDCPNISGETPEPLTCFSSGVLDELVNRIRLNVVLFIEISGSRVWSENAGANAFSVGTYFLGWLIFNTYTNEREQLRSATASLGVSLAGFVD
ncbi:hypothetical protein HC928_11305, partial [bacterium]|nr:hypothetical protein [bacterium]